jgi:hypothetical protein
MKDINKLPQTFFITYYAKTHNGEPIKGGGKFITRKACEPNPKGTAGRMFTDKNGTDRFIYWDLDAGDWRHATGSWQVKAVA